MTEIDIYCKVLEKLGYKFIEELCGRYTSNFLVYKKDNVFLGLAPLNVNGMTAAIDTHGQLDTVIINNTA